MEYNSRMAQNVMIQNARDITHISTNNNTIWIMCIPGNSAREHFSNNNCITLKLAEVVLCTCFTFNEIGVSINIKK